MGTSGSNGGPGNHSPLIPGFLSDPAPPPALTPIPSSPLLMPTSPGTSLPPGLAVAPVTPSPGTPSPPAPRPVVALAPQLGRFTSSRANFSSFSRSGGSDRKALGRALSRYVSNSAGGARQAAQRMGSARQAGAGLYSFLSDAQARGAAEALRALDLQSLAGRPIDEIFLGVAEYVCPIGGSVDEGIARDAFMEMIAELADEGIKDFDSLTQDQMQTVFEMFTTNAIEARIYNDIGKNGIRLPADVQAVEDVQAQLHDFISRAVSDALTQQAQSGPLSKQQALNHVDAVYEAAFEMLRIHAEAEANK